MISTDPILPDGKINNRNFSTPSRPFNAVGCDAPREVQSSAVIIYHDIALGITMTAVERKVDFKLTTDTTYLALRHELWGVYCDELGENWLRYNAPHCI